MKFRTEIEPQKPDYIVAHTVPLLMLGSCFTDEVGSRLVRDGFDALVNPLGPIYNPIMLARTLERALRGNVFEASEFVSGPRGCHCLDYATRYSGEAATVLSLVNTDIAKVAEQLRRAPVEILTFGSAYVYEYQGRVIGNCHKFPAAEFTRRLLTVEEIVAALSPVMADLEARGCRIILTVSPIRHLADGLHGNTLSKSVLHLAADELCRRFAGVRYFPSFEILIDDLRDYRFYASDMKHPSEVAVDYIYDIFSQTFMSPDTRAKALQARKEFTHSQHRPIL